MDGPARRSIAIVAAAVLLLAASPAALGQNRPEAPVASTHLLRQLYTSGLARMAKGDPAAAADVFRVAAEVAPELPQMHFSYGLARVLADWRRREHALPSIEAALRAAPANPLYRVGKILADPALSQLGRDGALHLSPAGAAQLRAATEALGREKVAVNGRYLAAVLGAAQTTSDARHPLLLAGFDRMIGPGGKVRLPKWQEAQAFGRLFAATVPEAELQAYEPRMLARLQQGLDSLAPENMRRLQRKDRQLTLRRQLSERAPDAAAPPLD
jgi:hypothetical protein